MRSEDEETDVNEDLTQGVVLWHMLIILLLRKLRQEDCQFEHRRPSLKKQKPKNPRTGDLVRKCLMYPKTRIHSSAQSESEGMLAVPAQTPEFDTASLIALGLSWLECLPSESQDPPVFVSQQWG